VLVVDDDALTRMLMTRMLERMGCRVVTAENGEVALDRIVGIGVASPAPSAASLDLVGGELGTPEPRFAVIFLGEWDRLCTWDTALMSGPLRR
jgi:CheY-like chemotaxis protein